MPKRISLTTSDDLIAKLESELDRINEDEVNNYEQSYIWIRSQVDKLMDEDPSYSYLESWFDNFLSWKDVRERLFQAIEDRDAHELGFLVRYVDFDDDYYYINDDGFLLNIDADAVGNLLDNLLNNLRE